MPKRFLLPPNASARTKEVSIADALRQYADAYIESALLPDPNGETRFSDLLSGFRNYLLNHNIELRGRSTIEGPLSDALRARGTLLSRNHRFVLVGWRFRTPVDTR